MPKFFLPLFSVLFVGILFFGQKPFCANSESCLKNLDGEYEAASSEAIFNGNKVAIPKTLAINEETNVLAEVTSDEKRIEVDLTNQMLYAYENNNVVMSFPVSTGKWNRTPTGNFKIWIKLRYTRMSGGKPGTGTYYNLPNVPYTMYFYNEEHPKIQGYGLHGAYWHSNFGHPMSHGCVNISPENAGKLYNWATPISDGKITYASDENPGTKIVIYGSTPRE